MQIAHLDQDAFPRPNALVGFKGDVSRDVFVQRGLETEFGRPGGGVVDDGEGRRDGAAA